MAKLIAIYKQPKDPQAFDDYYFGTHVPLANTVPGLLGNEVSKGPVVTPQGPSPYHRVAILSFESMAALQQGLASPEGRATAADLANFADAGVELLVFDTQNV